MKRLILSLIFVVVFSIAIAGCSDGEKEVGTIQFNANGEDFVREGFVSKDGWSISFDHVYITLKNITAYQTDPPYDATSGNEIDSSTYVRLEGTYTVDLAEGGEDAAPILVSQVNN